MQIEVSPIELGQREILANLLEKYIYEFTQWNPREINALGLYGYRWLDSYWDPEEQNKRRWAYFIRADGQLAGFALVNDFPEIPDMPCDFSLAEFFVLHNHRRAGVGSAAARAVFDLHRGRWQLKYHTKNTVSVEFWHKVVGAYTNGRFALAHGTEDGPVWNVMCFENG